MRPEELTLRAGEEQSVVVSFTAQGTQKHREMYVHLSSLNMTISNSLGYTFIAFLQAHILNLNVFSAC